MRRSRAAAAVVAGVAAALLAGSGAASADTMHPKLAARLAGMGERGAVNFQSQAAKGKLCWTFELSTKGITRASIRDAQGMKVAELGMHYTARGCGYVAPKALRLIEARPARYRVWVDTKGHPGDLRGKLFAGMVRT